MEIETPPPPPEPKPKAKARKKKTKKGRAVGKSAKEDAKEFHLAERRAMALKLRISGGTYRQIAETMRNAEGLEAVTDKYSETLAFYDVQHELNRLHASNSEKAEEIRLLELMRLDNMLAALDPSIDSGDVAAIGTAIRIGESRRRLLGLDAPTKIAQTTPDGAALENVALQVNFVTPSEDQRAIENEVDTQ